LRAIPPEKDPLAELVRGRLEIMGPVTAEKLSLVMAVSLIGYQLCVDTPGE
jgi:hypothetical protein